MQNKQVYCFEIIYTNRESIISITGINALRNFVDGGYLNVYDGQSAPTKLTIDISLADNYLDDIISTEKAIKSKLEEDVGLSVKTFKFIVL